MSDLSTVLSALAGLAAVDPHELTDGELAGRLVEIERAARMVQGARAATLAVFDARDAHHVVYWVDLGETYLDTAAYSGPGTTPSRALADSPSTADPTAAGKPGHHPCSRRPNPRATRVCAAGSG